MPRLQADGDAIESLALFPSKVGQCNQAGRRSAVLHVLQRLE